MDIASLRVPSKSEPDAHALESYRWLTGLGGLVYLIWWGLVEVFLPGSINPLPGRLAVVAMCWAAYLLSFRSARLFRSMQAVFGLCAWLITLHYFYLFYLNKADINWVVGSYITIIAACASMRTQAEILSYSAWVLTLSIALVFLDPLLFRTIFLPGVVTILTFAFVGLRSRLKWLERSEQESHISKMRDEFLSIASHELKTPLTNIKVQTQLALAALHGAAAGTVDPSRLRKLVEQTDRQADRLTRLIDDMLDVSRISVGKLRLEESDFELTGLIKEVAGAFEAALRKSGSTIELQVSEPLMLHGDAFRIEQVIYNLLSNAIKYGEGQPIVVTATRTREGAEMIVRDRGIGIDREDLERIFDRFERARGVRSITGLGLGLYISRSIVEAHGGSIQAFSDADQGTRFVVRLPASGSARA